MTWPAMTYEPKPYPEESLRFLLHPSRCEHEVYMAHWSEATTGMVVLEWNRSLYQIVPAKRKR